MTQDAAVPETRALIVDDTPDMRLLLRVVLSRYEGYTVVAEAGDGRAAIDAAREHQPDLVLLDLAMPIMDGLEALPHIRAAAPDARVVVLSGFEADRMADSAIAAGASGYLQKGTKPDKIIAKLAAVLGRPAPAAASPAAGPERRTAPTPEPEPNEHIYRAVATAAHELRNPAIALTVLSDELLRSRDDLSRDAVDQILEAIARQAEVIDQLTNDLLTSTHARRGSLIVRPEPANLLSALTASTKSFELPGDLHIDCKPDLTVMIDRVRFEQVVSNLLSNSVKYGAPPVEIDAVEEDERVIIRVRDHGEGVPEWFRDDLFTEYARAEPWQGNGTGVGLHIVRSIALAGGGDAWYEPQPDGAMFCVSVPCPKV